MLVINVFKKKRKRKDGGGKYGLIRSNWDPAGCPLRPLMEEKKNNELAVPQAGWTCSPITAVPYYSAVTLLPRAADPLIIPLPVNKPSEEKWTLK
jgi:hypothetical protein